MKNKLILLTALTFAAYSFIIITGKVNKENIFNYYSSATEALADCEVLSIKYCPGGSCKYVFPNGESCCQCCPAGKVTHCDALGCRCTNL